MTSLPEQQSATVEPMLRVQPVSGIWELQSAAVRDDDLAAILVLALHRGLTPTPSRKTLPVHIST
jgi:hypothetical protein